MATGICTARGDLPDDLDRLAFDLGAAHRQIDRHRVDVELDRRRSRLRELARVADPSLGVVPLRLAMTGMSSAALARCSVSSVPTRHCRNQRARENSWWPRLAVRALLV
jgi:hypothetical protein